MTKRVEQKARPGTETERGIRTFARIVKFFAPPVFKGDEDKTRRGRVLNAVLLMDTAGMSLMLSIDLLSGNIPALILFLELTAVFVLLALRIPMRQGKITQASYGPLLLFLMITSAALVTLGTTRDPTLGAFILLVLTAGLLLNRRGILVITGGCILAVSALMIAERAGWLRTPRMTIELPDWGTITVLLIVSAWIALWFRESLEKSLFRARQELAERMRAEETLRENEERFKALSSMTSEGIMIHENGIILDANPAFTELIGYSNPDGLIGKNGLEAIPLSSESRQRVLAHISSGSTESYEIEVVRSDGSITSAETHGKEITYQGRPMRLVSMRDVTERKRADLQERAVYEIARASERAIGLDDLYHSIHLIIKSLMPAENFYVALYDEQADLLSFPYFVDEIDVVSSPTKPGRGLTEYVLRTGRPLLCDEAADEELTRRGEVELVGAPSSCWLGAPLKVGERVIGVIAVQHYSDPKAYGEREKQVLDFVSGQVARTIERQRAEEALRESEEKHRAIIETNQEWIWRINIEGIHTYSNRTVEQILGYSIEDIVGTNATIFMHPEDRRAIENMIPKMIEDRKGWNNLVVRWLHKDGSMRWLESNAVVMLDVAGEVIGFQGSDRDITERVRADVALRESEASFRTLSENLLVGIYIIQNGLLAYVNPALEKIFGYESGELLGSSPLAIVHPDDHSVAKENMRRLVAGEVDSIRYVYHGRCKNGESKYFEVIGARSDWKGAPAILGNLQDITERKKAEETVQASLREKEVLIREIHHRVKNNMQVISSLFNLQAGHIKDEDARRMLKEGQLRIRSMALIHEKLYRSRDLSKIEFASYLRSLTTHLFQFFRVDPERVRLETDLESMSLDINTAVPCGLLFNELVSNALKHAFPDGRKGTVRVWLRREKNGTIELGVADDGMGLPDALDFRRTESFGLQIADLLVGQLEGTVELDRKNGTAFTLRFRELDYKPRAWN